MFSSLLGTRKGRHSERTPLLSSWLNHLSRQHHNPDHSASEDHDHEDTARYYGEDEDDEGANRGRRDGPLLPVFSETLDQLPIYSTTHAIRILVIQRCETTLCWDQLRSPQVSQFLVKPIQQRILAEQLSRGSIYCLLVNCLQFRKEASDYPANEGVSRTRALICELLAMRLLKEFSTRELIDALSYDFDPLQGMALPAFTGSASPGGQWLRQRRTPLSARSSALEVAIKAQAKKFLAHPLVVHHLEAIWAGTIVFHSSADNLHRSTEQRPASASRSAQWYGTGRDVSPRGKQPQQSMEPLQSPSPRVSNVRRSVTLYDPHDASLFKLSRLRVPRYRSLFSTLSFAIMLVLFVAVLFEKSDDITGLEVLFWFWSAGYMLDEIVGWSEQGFGLYIMSVWNAFDLGILFMFMVYYVLRLYGILITDAERHSIARMAYDVLGATAVLLFPRLFSALDHARYFSQLLIAFRMMALDLIAVMVLIIIACSGFFVAFTLAFGKGFTAPDAAYALFQMLMGFTPAAWELWGGFNPLGKALLTLFLFICHFLIVTILITVLTNSFMAIVQNANEEHQFLFAVNTISMVKSDALFAYIAPTNIIGWLVIPLRYCMPFRRFIRMNRLIIKITHVPILFSIFVYERVLLSNLAYEPTDMVEQRGRPKSYAGVPTFSIRGAAADLFSPSARLREPSITTFRKDRALEEVFRRPFRETSVQASGSRLPGRRKSSNLVTDWMRGMGNNQDAFPPQEDTRSVLDRLEARSRPVFRRTKTGGYVPKRRKQLLSAHRSVASDPDQSLMQYDRPIAEEEEPDMSMEDLPQQTDADGDDELVTNSEDNGRTSQSSSRRRKDRKERDTGKQRADDHSSEEEFFRTPMTVRPRSMALVSSPSSYDVDGARDISPSREQSRPNISHSRNLSTNTSNTVLFSPIKDTDHGSSFSSSPPLRPSTANRSGKNTPRRAFPDGHRTPKRHTLIDDPPSRPRAILPPKDSTFSRSASNIAGFSSLDHDYYRRREPERQTSFNTVALDLASDLGDNRHVPDFGALGGLPASFTTQFAMAARGGRVGMGGLNRSDDDESSRMSRIMLARMTTLEEGFRDVLREVKGLKKGSADGRSSRGGGGVRTTGNTSPVEMGARKRGKGSAGGAKRRGGKEGSGASEGLLGSSV
ncbi:uncharacterized protein EI97DRAFT_289836 [Westerdykella ornata]|uniref:Uncharacterized protein n=1 Tax=Westerdykella ornata TaxID=318751 RepID=A0A6A6JLC6_WESOR|nr:uncharacterized protein EI97DRAFT_289836 [Westerdykella ornata]KAF2277391.1 hypothetical protein EI97DRAFT_289836 [Westerdykella ornata]